MYIEGAAFLKCELNFSYPSWRVQTLTGNDWTFYNYLGSSTLNPSLSPDIRDRLRWMNTQTLRIAPLTLQDDGEYECLAPNMTLYTIRLFIWGNNHLFA